MRRSILFTGLALALVMSSPARSQDMAAEITRQLHDQGFSQIDVRRTLLGRTRILATSAEGQREIIVNPSTGEILRDLWQPADGSPDVRVLTETPSEKSGGTSGKGAGSDPGSTSGGDGQSSGDDGEDDHSGSGSNGSGSGGSNGSGSGGSGSGGSGSGGSGSGNSGSGSGGSGGEGSDGGGSDGGGESGHDGGDGD